MRFKNIIILSIIYIVFNGCAPSFSEFQGADLIGKGKIEVTPYFSSTSSDDFEIENDDENSNGNLQDNKGIRIAYGLNENYNTHFKYEIIEGEGGFIDGSLISLGIKFKLYANEKHRYSGCLPISYYTQRISFSDPFTGESENESAYLKTIEPTLLGSSKIYKNIDINYSAKIIKQIDADDTSEDTGYAFNLSSSIPISKFTLIPEYGVLNIEDQSYNHSGVGISIQF